jgi:hypothetical protein
MISSDSRVPWFKALEADIFVLWRVPGLILSTFLVFLFSSFSTWLELIIDFG